MSLIAIWALLAMPVLCTTEVLEHHCGCAPEEECTHGDPCPHDTCHSPVLSNRPTRAIDMDHANPDLPVIAIAAIAPCSLDRFAQDLPAEPLTPSRVNLPFAESDVPLLV